MIEEVGTVVELKEQRIAVVMCKRNSACEHCPSSGACSMGDNSETMLVDAINMIRAQVGDQVKVVASTKHFLQSSFMLYIVPIIGLLIGALIGESVGKRASLGIDPSLMSALTAVAFLVVTFILIRLATMRLKREAFMPRIIAKQAG
ncbi:SoxR reducing system RseC family protein [Malonomonas rubra]|nr:SoxR reducing system RseC family protein [Malonomonas rubra]